MTATDDRTTLTAPAERTRGVRWWTVVAIGVAALAGGILVGVLVDDGGDQGLKDEVAAVAAERDQLAAEIGALPAWSGSDVIAADGDELTSRHTDMIDITNDMVAAWQATDGDRVAAHMTPDGRLEYLLEGWMFSVSDGSLQNRVNGYGLNSVQPVGPMVVSTDRVVVFGTHPAGDWLTIFHFTRQGDVDVVGVYHL